MSIEKLDHIVSGAIFDFAGYLTTRKQRLVISAADNAAPMADAVRDFLGLRDVAAGKPPWWKRSTSCVAPCWTTRCLLGHGTATWLA